MFYKPNGGALFFSHSSDEGISTQTRETPWPEAAIFQWQPTTSEPSFSCWVVDRGEDFSWWTRAWESSVFILFVGKRIVTLEAVPQMIVNVRLQGHWSLLAGLKKHCGSWRAGRCAHPLAFLWERLWFCSTQETSPVNRQTPDTWWPRLPCSPSLARSPWSLCLMQMNFVNACFTEAP